jgi:hypothetical protein
MRLLTMFLLFGAGLVAADTFLIKSVIANHDYNHAFINFSRQETRLSVHFRRV